MQTNTAYRWAILLFLIATLFLLSCGKDSPTGAQGEKSILDFTVDEVTPGMFYVLEKNGVQIDLLSGSVEIEIRRPEDNVNVITNSRFNDETRYHQPEIDLDFESTAKAGLTNVKPNDLFDAEFAERILQLRVRHENLNSNVIWFESKDEWIDFNSFLHPNHDISLFNAGNLGQKLGKAWGKVLQIDATNVVIVFEAEFTYEGNDFKLVFSMKSQPFID